MYQDGKQTVAKIARKTDLSPSTIKRVLRDIAIRWEQPDLTGRSGFVHLDVTYWGHNRGVFLALDDESCRPLYLAFIHHETIADHEKAVKTIADLGYVTKGIVIDGMRSLSDNFSSYRIQMCQYHMLRIVKRYLTKSPRLKVSRSLKNLMKRLVGMGKDDFMKEYARWKEEYSQTLNRCSVSKRDGKSHYTHKRQRTAMNSVDFYLPPVHLSEWRLPRNARHQQQDRGHLHRPEEEPQQPQRHERAESQEVHQWVFLGIGR